MHIEKILQFFCNLSITTISWPLRFCLPPQYRCVFALFSISKRFVNILRVSTFNFEKARKWIIEQSFWPMKSGKYRRYA